MLVSSPCLSGIYERVVIVDMGFCAVCTKIPGSVFVDVDVFIRINSAWGFKLEPWLPVTEGGFEVGDADTSNSGLEVGDADSMSNSAEGGLEGGLEVGDAVV